MMKATVLLWCAVGIISVFSVPLKDDVTPRPGETCGYDSCTEAEDGLLNVHIVPHTHDDVGWLKTVDQYYYGSRNSIQKAGVQYILDSVIKELWEDPKRRFIYVETAFFWKWWVRQTDSVRHKVHVLVRQGRLQFVGGAWSMNDEAASHYQSTIDQFTWGLGKLNQTFGACGIPRVGWQIDPFGHSREFASLLAAMKYDGLFLGRIDYQDKSSRKQGRSMEMVWRGDDDLGKQSDLFTGVLYNTYSPPPNFCFDVLCSDEPIIDDPDSPMFNVEARVNEFLSYVKNQSTAYKTKNVIVTMGGDFTYQDATMWYKNLDKLIENANLKAAKEGLNIKLFYSTPDCYLKAVHDANPTLPTKQDDFFPYASDPNSYWTGYFTSRPTTKFFERQANSYLQMAKQLQVLAGLEDHNRFVLNELKSAMGVMQHHDAITGTEKQHVTHDYERLLDEAIDDALIIPRQAFNKMMQGDPLKAPLFIYERCRLNESSCDTSENSQQFVVTVYNHLGWNANESIRIPVVEGTYAVYAPNGEQIVSQIVDIPKEVQNIPTRHSKATHEIVFIAYLKPVSYKSYYIKRVTKLKRNVDPYSTMDEAKQLKRKTDYYSNINNYWSKIKAKPYVEIKNIEDDSYRNPDLYDTIEKEHSVRINRKAKPIYEPSYYRDSKFENPPKDVDLDVLKDGKNFFNRDIEQLEKIINEVKHLPKKTNFREGMEKAMVYPSLNDEEMRMLADDPMIVEMYSDEAYLENDDIKLRLESGDITHVVFPDGTSTRFSPKFFYYPGCVGDNESASRRSSGAYIFRPNATAPFELESNYTEGPKGAVVNEIRGVLSENVASTIRLYNDLKYIEHDWVVGPINIEDNEGKEFVVKYMTDIVNNGEFYTDSNGRQMLKRKLNSRPQWNVTLAEPVAGNYYPVTNKIVIEDGNNRLAVTPDRSEGGASLQEGEVELMLHRRLLRDDAFGVGEALNETANGKGLVVRGKHRIFITKSGSKEDYLEEKKQVIQYHLQPQVFVSDAAEVSLDDWMKLTKAHSWVNELPNGIHLLTLEPWYGKTLLLRLENYLETTDAEVTTVDVDLKAIFKDLEVQSFKETSLAANQWLDDSHKWNWVAENEFSDRFNKAYGSFDAAELAKDRADAADEGFKVKIKAKEIRTFVVNY